MHDARNARDPIAHGCISTGRTMRKHVFRARNSGEDQSTFARRGAACGCPSDFRRVRFRGAANGRNARTLRFTCLYSDYTAYD